MSARAIVAGIVAGGLLAMAPGPADVAPMSLDTLPACANEDGSGGPVPCVWDASQLGNGVGASYLLDAGGATFYLAHADVAPMADGGTRFGCDAGYEIREDRADYVSVRCIPQV